MANRRFRVLVSGNVQGVGYRFSAQASAHSLGLGGWVRNRSDGRVELLAEGDEDSLERMVEWCRRGPPGAWVEEVSYEEEPYRGEFHGFTVAPTAS